MRREKAAWDGGRETTTPNSQLSKFEKSERRHTYAEKTLQLNME